MKPMDEDDRLYLLFGTSSFDMFDLMWDDLVEVETLGLLRLPSVQAQVLRFDPTSIGRFSDILSQCKSKGLSQKWALIEWAQLNPEYIPEFILRMQDCQEFRGWFKSCYDTLRLMFKRLIQIDLPFIPELEDELRENYLDQVGQKMVWLMLTCLIEDGCSTVYLSLL